MKVDNLSVLDLKNNKACTENSFPEELINELKSFGEPDASKPWLDYSSFEFNTTTAEWLIKIVKDEDDDFYYNDLDDDSSESVIWWVPLHAWRILLTEKYEPALENH